MSARAGLAFVVACAFIGIAGGACVGSYERALDECVSDRVADVVRIAELEGELGECEAAGEPLLELNAETRRVVVAVPARGGRE